MEGGASGSSAALAAKMIADYETKQAELLGENAELRDSLRSLTEEVQRVFAARSSSKQWLERRQRGRKADEASEPAGDDDEDYGAKLSLPFAWVQGDLEAGIRTKLDELQRETRRIMEAEQQAADVPAEATSSLDEDARKIISEQDGIIRALLAKSHGGGQLDALARGKLDISLRVADQLTDDDSMIEGERESLKREVDAVREERRLLEEARRQFEVGVQMNE